MRPSLLPVEDAHLTVELLNEPIATVDNGYRVELIVPREEFKYTVSSCSIQCTIGQSDMLYPGFRSTTNLKLDPDTKLSCQHSVLNIYDTYGLKIAKFYLNNLLIRRHLLPVIRTSYLYYSLLAIDPASNHSHWKLGVNELSRLVMSKLNELEANKPRCTEEITLAIDLPVELLVRIINSKRISKLLSVQVEQFRQTEPFSHQELEQAKLGQCTYFSNKKWSACYALPRLLSYIRSMEWTLEEVASQTYSLNHKRVETDLTGLVVQYSIVTYCRAFKLRGCNAKQAILSMLTRLREQFRVISDGNILEACAWIVQLSLETLSDVNTMLSGYEEVGAAMQLLIDNTYETNKLAWKQSC
ncbi:Hypothetical protein POVR2_LOCUS99 [uncultured virus]|nr:Hypothetical protein POVR2_LOCUS99 [uncultured virus]